MRIWGLFAILGIFLVLLLSGCQSEIRGQQLGDGIVIDDPCLDVTCGATEVCEEGACVCGKGYKDCNGQCIPESGCCGDDQCELGESCVNNVCEFKCENVQCESNKICNESKQGCFCKAGYTWCKLQNTCIPDDHCCTKFDCGRDEKCVNTAIRVNFCIEGGKDRNCKLLNDLDSKDFVVSGKEFEVFMEDHFYTIYAQFLINGGTYTLQEKDRQNIGQDTILWLKDLDYVGGGCKLFDSRRIGRGSQ